MRKYMLIYSLKIEDDTKYFSSWNLLISYLEKEIKYKFNPTGFKMENNSIFPKISLQKVEVEDE